MAVPKTTELGVGMAVCRQDMLYKDYTSNPLANKNCTPNDVYVLLNMRLEPCT